MSEKSTAHGKGGLARQAGTPQTTEVARESASCKGKNHVFLPCEECKHNGRCKRKSKIPHYCLKGCMVEDKRREK